MPSATDFRFAYRHLVSRLLLGLIVFMSVPASLWDLLQHHCEKEALHCQINTGEIRLEAGHEHCGILDMKMFQALPGNFHTDFSTHEICSPQYSILFVPDTYQSLFHSQGRAPPSA